VVLPTWLKKMRINLDFWDCPPTPPLSHYFALAEK